MRLKAGQLVESTAALNETIFDKTTIYIVTYNNKGTVGFIINQPFSRSLNELDEFKYSPSFPLHTGGPVDKEHLFFIHRRPDVIHEADPIEGGIYLGGNFKQAITGINNRTLSKKEIKIFVGYCGWDGGELEAEIEEGSWLLRDGSSELIFS